MIRHGQSTWNAQKRWQGQANPPLSDFGRHQAQIAARNLGTVDLVVSSPQLRALETATILAQATGVGPVITHEGLRERAVGEWSGLTSTEIHENYPGWLDGGRRPPGWEPDQVLEDRILEAIEAITTTYEADTILVVAHGGVVLAVEDHLQVRDGRIPNLHGRTVIRHSQGQLSAGERLELVPPELSTGGTGRRQ